MLSGTACSSFRLTGSNIISPAFHFSPIPLCLSLFFPLPASLEASNVEPSIQELQELSDLPGTAHLHLTEPPPHHLATSPGERLFAVLQKARQDVTTVAPSCGSPLLAALCQPCHRRRDRSSSAAEGRPEHHTSNCKIRSCFFFRLSCGYIIDSGGNSLLQPHINLFITCNDTSSSVHNVDRRLLRFVEFTGQPCDN